MLIGVFHYYIYCILQRILRIPWFGLLNIPLSTFNYSFFSFLFLPFKRLNSSFLYHCYHNQAVIAISPCRVSSISTSHLRITRRFQPWTLCIVNMWRMGENPGMSSFLFLFISAWGNESARCSSVIHLCPWDYNRGLPMKGKAIVGGHVWLFEWMYVLSCRYMITDIIGKDEGLGVENLKGSGMIAGESSLAYEEIITMNLVRLKWPPLCIHVASSTALSCTPTWSFKSKDYTLYCYSWGMGLLYT